jgi:hypothetical protein
MMVLIQDMKEGRKEEGLRWMADRWAEDRREDMDGIHARKCHSARKRKILTISVFLSQRQASS